jgi:hypothetical protein
MDKLPLLMKYTSSTYPPDIISNTIWIFANCTINHMAANILLENDIVQILLGLLTFGYEALA